MINSLLYAIIIVYLIPSFGVKEFCPICDEVKEVVVSCRCPEAGIVVFPVFRAKTPCDDITPVVLVRLKVSLRFLYKGTKG